MAAGALPNLWGEAQRRTRASVFFAAKRSRGAGLPAGKKEACEGFGRRDGCHRSSSHKQGIVSSRKRSAGLAGKVTSPSGALSAAEHLRHGRSTPADGKLADADLHFRPKTQDVEIGGLR